MGFYLKHVLCTSQLITFLNSQVQNVSTNLESLHYICIPSYYVCFEINIHFDLNSKIAFSALFILDSAPSVMSSFNSISHRTDFIQTVDTMSLGNKMRIKWSNKLSTHDRAGFAESVDRLHFLYFYRDQEHGTPVTRHYKCHVLFGEVTNICEN